MRKRHLLFLAVVAGGLVWAADSAALPLKPGSVRFAIIGDNGTGGKEQYEVARQMESLRDATSFDFVLMMGDNMYGGESPSDFRKKFEEPYALLMEKGVKFYASLGNHDNPNERFYKPFNMNEKRYYNFRRGNVEFFALDSTYMDMQQLSWLDSQLSASGAAWKICFFHHPMYSDGKFHGPDLDLRKRLEPVLLKNGVNVVFNGHEHFYERLVPQNGIYYFIEGSSGELRKNNVRPSPSMAKSFDTDRAFMGIEIAGDQLYYEAISRTGATIDSGTLDRQTARPAANPPAR